MTINWKVRFKNKAFVVSFATIVIGFIYQVLGLFGITPSISDSVVINLITTFVNVLAMVGSVGDPTTEGISDSDRAMTYE